MRTAVEHNNVPIVSFLISNGLDTWHMYSNSAINHKARDVLSYFLSIGWQINDTSRLNNHPGILGWVVQDEEMLVWLIDHGANPNQPCQVDMTPTSIAVEEAPLSTLQLLFKRGANINKGELFHHAVERKSDEIAFIDYLLEKGANINKTRYDNDPHSMRFLGLFTGLRTPLHKAAKKRKASCSASSA
ncbi:ankyrin repeat-containing domain protein [Aspergillus crustosus]